MAMLSIDSHEPAEAEAYLAPSIEDGVKRYPLNERGFADYQWETWEDEIVHVERKTWGELIGSVPKIEDQLRRHIANQPTGRLILLLEGMITSTPIGVSILKATNRDRVWVAGRATTYRPGQLYAWLYQIGKHMEIYQTSDYKGTCSALAAFYKGDQKEEHTTFKRHFKEVAFNPNPQVTQLMGVFPGIGEQRAIKLIDRFSTVWNVIKAQPEELMSVDGIGPKLSRQLLQRVGRPDV
jgi:ERCC4-type nuclease